jgi:hypothetical protein
LFKQYFWLQFATSNKERSHEWFLVWNFEPSLLMFTDETPLLWDSWREHDACKQGQLKSILELVMVLVWEGLTSEVVLQMFFGWRIQLLWVQELGIWRYAGSTDPTHESVEELTNMEVDAQIKSVLEVGVMANIGPHRAPLH